ncbi:hypothetical protein ANN_07772 [Periplaneta americana]|uniref:Uncharacterized protein n=1 Tax=Periplaneta americana TaxID=6978 RepID=A0ABQ8SZI2_PERAM|nr:hypothetical protein ANN_07772 [Periplaneta americana]
MRLGHSASSELAAVGHWMACSPHLKSLVYVIPITESEEELITRVLAAGDSLQHMPGVFEHVRQAMTRFAEFVLKQEAAFFNSFCKGLQIEMVLKYECHK